MGESVPAFIIFFVVIAGSIAIFVSIENSKNTDFERGFACSEEVIADYTTSGNTSKEIIEYINQFRNESGKSILVFDARAYDLAISRANDMVEYEYYAHTNPYTGVCSENVKQDFGFSDGEYISQIIFEIPGVNHKSLCFSFEQRNATEVVDEWKDQENSRNNLLYAGHLAGAVGCKLDVCVFIGVNSNRYGNRCI
ncbi:MAG: CAP domain-containing protein [Candidatus Altiarchaeota archaeon]|nr:CAP domain-containing protein [Candidatus Altiarchaeota archaeon]